jgi:hypothetical protein
MGEFDDTVDEFGESDGPEDSRSPVYDPRVSNGVTANWLGQMFQMDPRTVRKKLAKISPIGRGKGGSDLWNFRKACQYLVDPEIDLNEYLQTIRPEQLPNKINRDYWDAKLKEMKFREEAGQLWRTELVLEVFAETLKHMRGCMNLWIDTIEKNATTTSEQKKVIKDLVDSLQNDMHGMLLERGKTGTSKSYLEEQYDE